MSTSLSASITGDRSMVDEVLTTDELMSFLKIGRGTVYRLLKQGELRAFKVGSNWRFNRVHVEEWMKNHAVDKRRIYRRSLGKSVI